MTPDKRGVASRLQTSAGSSQSDAASLIGDFVMVESVAEGSGVILPACNMDDRFAVVNGDGTNPLLVYPPVGAEFNNHGANEPLNLPAGKGAQFIGVDSLNILALVS